MSSKVIQRQEEILDCLSSQRVLSVKQLAANFHVSIETIRKDLAALSAKDLVVRVHGGVGLSNAVPNSFNNQVRLHQQEKKTIADLAIRFVKPHTSIMIEDGSTGYAFAQTLLQAKPDLLSTLTIITNSFSICDLFGMGAVCEWLFFLGGLCDSGRKATLGHYASQQLSAFHAQQLFIAPAGISPALQVVAWSTCDAAFQIEAIKNADEKILMTDSTKFLSTGWLNVAPLETFDHIVTDMDATHPMVEQMLRKNLPVYLPGREMDGEPERKAKQEHRK